MARPPGSARLQKEIRRTLAGNLRRHRERLGWTQEKAAERAGFSLQYYQRCERCIVNVPLDTLVRFARAFGVDPADLLQRTQDF